MKVSVLTENTSKCDKFQCEHGLSLYIEFEGHKILFDTGSTDCFINNAKELNIDIKEVDTVVISHGHDDHGGGLKSFLEINKGANIYIHKKAFEDHFSKKSEDKIVSIGLNKELVNNNQIKLIENDKVLFDNVETMLNTTFSNKMPLTNGNLLKLGRAKYEHDDFVHEQNLVFKTENGYVLIMGCAHNGVKNILESFKKKYNTMPKYVIGGFHLSSRTKSSESDEFIRELAQYLLETNAMYYTCHCTGEKAYLIMKEIMKNKIEYIRSGCQFNI